MNNNIFRCQCGSHLIEHITDPEYKDEHILLFWKLNGEHNNGFIRRLKEIYRILFFGRIFISEIILNDEDANKLSNLLKNDGNSI